MDNKEREKHYLSPSYFDIKGWQSAFDSLAEQIVKSSPNHIHLVPVESITGLTWRDVFIYRFAGDDWTYIILEKTILDEIAIST
jgi:hypothetical protein